MEDSFLPTCWEHHSRLLGKHIRVWEGGMSLSAGMYVCVWGGGRRMGGLASATQDPHLILKKDTHQNLGLKHGEHLHGQTSSTRHHSARNSDTCEMPPRVARLTCASELSGQERGEKSCVQTSNTIWFVKRIAPACVCVFF